MILVTALSALFSGKPLALPRPGFQPAANQTDFGLVALVSAVSLVEAQATATVQGGIPYLQRQREEIRNSVYSILIKAPRI